MSWLKIITIGSHDAWLTRSWQLLDTDGLLLPSAAGSDEALAAYKARRKARIDKEMHAKEKGGDISFGQ